MSQESAESRRILAGELALGLVHEMNQPIQLLAGHLERLREGAPPEWARSLVSMERAVQRISLLVRFCAEDLPVPDTAVDPDWL